MKKTFTYSLLVVLLLMLSCHDTSDSSSAEQVTSSPFDPTVGRQIPFETAQRWRALYEKGVHEKESGAARKEEPYTIKAARLNQLLQAVEDRAGVIFHHATDNSGTYHILVTAVSKTNGLWNSLVVIDANTNSLVPIGTASVWARQYTDAHPGQIRYHFFGANIFKEIMANSNFNYFDIALR